MFSSEKWFGGGADNFYSHTINQSLRLNDADASYLSRTHDTGDREKWTFSFWVKRGDITKTLVSPKYEYILHTSLTGGTAHGYIYFDNDRLTYWEGAVVFRTTAVFRDPSSWYNIVVARDSAQSGNAKCKIYVNGTELTSFETDNRSSNTGTSYFNQNIGHYISTSQAYSIDGYLAEINFIDGAMLTQSSFGETKAGIWIAKDTSNLSFGTNGFRLTFQGTGTSTTSQGTTAQTNIGDDQSGGGHNWAVTSIVSADVVLDSPNRNFAVFNSILPIVQDFHEGNLKCNSTENNFEIQAATVFPSNVSGKWYAEFYIHTVNGSTLRVGVGVTSINTNPTLYLGEAADDIGYYEVNDIYRGGSKIADTDASFTAGDIVSVSLDLDAGEVTFRKNNSTMSNGTQSLTSNKLYTIATTNYGNTAGVIANFGQDNTFSNTKSDGAGAADANGVGEFYYSPPSGYLALCAANLSNPGIDPAQDEEPADFFNTVLYTGNGSSYTDTQAISGVGFSPDFTWIKARSASYSHVLNDRVRGAGKNLFSDSDTTENVGGSTGDLFTSFDSDGFTVNYKYGGGSNAAVNGNGTTYVAWNWLAGGSAVSNSNGTITSSASANTKAGFSIVSYTGNGSAGATVGHGLASAPELFITKRRSQTDPWQTYVASLGATKRLELDATSAAITSTASFNDTEPNSSVFTLGSGGYGNASSATYIAYCFHSVDGYSKVGSFTGNGSADGAFIYTGFRPAWLMIKSYDQTRNWTIFDNKRTPFNLMDGHLHANASVAEQTGSDEIDFLSNGFKFRSPDADSNYSNFNYIYLAFSEQPFKYANAR
tara:strand:+ start:12578 stop:15043 length:2466 start_codon:yes stop_codon:yes gene_type:complete